MLDQAKKDLEDWAKQRKDTLEKTKAANREVSFNYTCYLMWFFDRVFDKSMRLYFRLKKILSKNENHDRKEKCHQVTLIGQKHRSYVTSTQNLQKAVRIPVEWGHCSYIWESKNKYPKPLTIQSEFIEFFIIKTDFISAGTVRYIIKNP